MVRYVMAVPAGETAAHPARSPRNTERYSSSLSRGDSMRAMADSTPGATRQ
jgi:hypothetical protein